MSRRPTAGRLQELVDAATRVFAQRGYQRAQMAEIAREMGVSPGTLYLYVESKEALFSLVLRCATQNGAWSAPETLPVPTPAPGTLLQSLFEQASEASSLPALAEALECQNPADPPAELRRVVLELYETTERHRRALDVLERSSLDWPELAEVFTIELRRSILNRLTRYVELRTRAGQWRRVPHIPTAACFILQTVAWFAWQRYGNPDSALIPDDDARETVVQLLVCTFCGDPKRPTETSPSPAPAVASL